MSFLPASKRLSILLALGLPLLLYFLFQRDEEVIQYNQWKGKQTIIIECQELPLLLEVVDRLDDLQVLQINFTREKEQDIAFRKDLINDWAISIDQLGELTNLQELRLYNSQLTYVEHPMFFKNFGDLKVLRLAGVRLEEECYAPLVHLEELYLVNMGHFPSAELPSLKRLAMRGMSTVYLPRYIKHLPQLETLNFSDVTVNYIGNIVNYFQVQHLSIKNGHLGPEQEGRWSIAIPTEGVPQMKTLSLPNCGLEIMPFWLLELTQLRHLDLSGNRITEDWLLLEELTALEVLDASGNPIDSLPAAVTQLPNLQKITL